MMLSWVSCSHGWKAQYMCRHDFSNGTSLTLAGNTSLSMLLSYHRLKMATPFSRQTAANAVAY